MWKIHCNKLSFLCYLFGETYQKEICSLQCISKMCWSLASIMLTKWSRKLVHRSNLKWGFKLDCALFPQSSLHMINSSYLFSQVGLVFFPFANQNSVAIMINLQNFSRMKHKFKKKRWFFLQPPNKNIQLELRRRDQNGSIFIFLEVESRGLSKPLIAPYLSWLLSLNVFAKQSVSFYYATKYLHCWQNNGLNMSSQMFCWNCLFYLFCCCCFSV